MILVSAVRPMTVLLVVAALASCRGAERADDVAPPPGAAALGRWILVLIESDDVADQLAPDGRAPTLVLVDRDEVGGFAGVNSYSASFAEGTIAEGAFRLGPIAATLMAGPPEAMEMETRFLRLLAEARGARLEGGDLVLTAADGALLRFRREP